MTLFQQFLNEYNGKSNVGNTEKNKGECVGLVMKWAEILNMPHIWGHAKDLFVNADEQFYEKTLNEVHSTNKPSEGDIVVSSGGTYGHTYLATGSGQVEGKTTDWLEGFSQNDPIGSSCQLKRYKFTNIIGWLHPKVQPTDQGTLITQLKAEIEKYTKLYEDERNAKINLEDAVDKSGKINKALMDENQTDKQTIQSLTEEKKTISTSLQELKTSLSDTKTELDVCNGLMANRKELSKYDDNEIYTEAWKRITSKLRR